MPELSASPISYWIADVEDGKVIRAKTPELQAALQDAIDRDGVLAFYERTKAPPAEGTK